MVLANQQRAVDFHHFQTDALLTQGQICCHLKSAAATAMSSSESLSLEWKSRPVAICTSCFATGACDVCAVSFVHLVSTREAGSELSYLSTIYVCGGDVPLDPVFGFLKEINGYNKF